MKSFISKSITLLAISVITSALLLLPSRSPARNLFSKVSIYQQWNWNYGEPGHDPDWVIRGRGRENDNRNEEGSDNGRGNNGNNNGNGNGNGLDAAGGTGAEEPDPAVNICIGILEFLESILPGN